MLNSNSSQGIGDLVQRKKEAFQSNPGQLQQNYQKNKQLTDLLALQQLKTEKEDAARNMQLQMENNPKSIAQQREEEVLNLIKNNQNRSIGKISEQVGGVLGQKQKAAASKQASMGIMPQQNTGGAPMGAPAGAPPVLKAAQGGIIGFAGPDGSSVKGTDQNVEITEEEIVEEYGEKFLNYIKENPADAALVGMSFIPGLGLVGAGLKAAKTFGPALPRLAKLAEKYFKKDKGPDFEVTPKGTAVPKDRSQISPPTSKSKELVPYQGKPNPARPVDPGKEVGPFTPPKGGGIPTRTTTDALRVGQAGILASADTEDGEEDEESTNLYPPKLDSFPPKVKEKAPADAGGGVASLLSKFKQEPVSPDYESSTAQKDFARNLTNEIGLDPSRRPEDVRKERMAESRKEFNLDGDSGILAKKDDQLKRLKAQQKALSKEDRFDRFIAGASASARRGGPGGYGQGSLNERNSQKAQQRLDLTAQFGIENAKLQLEFDVTQAGTQSADKAADRLSREKNAYSTIMQNANAADRSAAEKVAKNVMDTNQFNITTELELLSQATTRNIAAAKGAADEIDRLENILADSLKERYEILAPMYDVAGGLSGETAEEIERKLGTIQIAQGMLSEAAGIFAQEEDTLRRLAQLGVDVSARSEKLSGDKALMEQVRAVQAMEAAEKDSGFFGGMFD